MILDASSRGYLKHPIVDDLPCPVLQYADLYYSLSNLMPSNSLY
jgi:hypothetical protein